MRSQAALRLARASEMPRLCTFHAPGFLLLSLLFGTVLLAGCGDLKPTPCTDAARAGHAALIQPLPDSVRLRIVQSFEQQDRIQRLDLTQADCHLRATVYVDSLATENYAIAQVEALVRELKKSAPGETKPLSTEPGEGIYDYLVTVRRDSASAKAGNGSSSGSLKGKSQPMLKSAKLYSESRVLWH